LAGAPGGGRRGGAGEGDDQAVELDFDVLVEAAPERRATESERTQPGQQREPFAR
jgi:hypothetical protein